MFFNNKKKKKNIIKFLIYNYKILKLKKEKLKLGKIVFEIEEIKLKNFPFVLYENIKIKFINQPQPEEKKKTFSKKLKYFFFFLLFIFFIIFFFTALIYFYLNFIDPSNFYEIKQLRKIFLKEIFSINFNQNILNFQNGFLFKINLIFINFLTDFLIDFSYKFKFIL
jgi:hypothetical protein